MVRAGGLRQNLSGAAESLNDPAKPMSSIAGLGVVAEA